MPALLSDTSAYAAQVLRTKKVEGISTRIGNPAGRPLEDIEGLKRQRNLEAQFGKGSEEENIAKQNGLLRQSTFEGVIDPVTTASQLGGDATMILSARGTFYLVKLAATYGPGIYSIDELTREVTAAGDNSFKRPGESTAPILLTSVEFNQVDITSQVPCLNNVKVFYSFGQNFGQVVISGEVLLGPLGDISYAGVERLVSFFWKHRVSVKHKPVAVSVANNSYFVYLTGLRIGQVNADFHIMPFTMFGSLLDITREQASNVNVRGQVMTGGSLSEPSLFQALRKIPPADQPYKLPGETERPTSIFYDPWANLVPKDTGGPVGPAAGMGAELNAKLTNEPKLQEEDDLHLLKGERGRLAAELASWKTQAAAGDPSAAANYSFYSTTLADLDEAIATQDTRVAQARYVSAGRTSQTMTPLEQGQANKADYLIRGLKNKQAGVAKPLAPFTPLPEKVELPDLTRTLQALGPS